MREIKFRAWDKVTKTIREVASIEFYSKIYNVRLIFPTDSAPQNWEVRTFDQVEIIQFTGLLDKNGKEIYKGDIVRLRYEGTIIFDREVKFIEAAFRFSIGAKSIGDYNENDLEIIGNIFENPELLKP